MPLDPHDFSHLSLKDLIEARDMFHVHLMHKRNVRATALGRYLIRETDLDENGRFRGGAPKTRRTLQNSLVIDISWPCILVFVEQWEEETTLAKSNASDLVPRAVYMPDGRVVPICVVEAPQEVIDRYPVDMDRLRFPENLIGGGYPLLIQSQGVPRVAAVGCVVTDGHKYYALTNHHVAGEAGEVVYSRIGGSRRRIGVTSGHSLGRCRFESLYPGWAGKTTLVNCDAGLIEIDDVNRWKTDVFTLGAFGEIYDLSTINLDLGLIAEHTLHRGRKVTLTSSVVAYGPASGQMRGEILAFFYRYKSVGGAEFVSDFLIAGEAGEDLRTERGDSGTLWLVEERDSGGKPTGMLRPIALHWGQHDFLSSGEARRTRFAYGLATSLSNVCRELDVDIVRGWNAALPYTWGKVGHYTVAARAIGLVTDQELKEFLVNNLANITFANDKINRGLDTTDNPDLPRDPAKGLCPLADVPDIIWKQSKKKTKFGRQGDENPNHYADCDAPSTGGSTLFQLCDSRDKLRVDVWDSYYENIDWQGMNMERPVSKGLISFRVWQIWDYMVAALEKKQADRFLFAAGVLAHYVGDACQPLHSSYMSNGDPADNHTIQYTAKRSSSKHQKGDVYPKTINPGEGVHTAYEDAMIDAQIDTIWPALNKRQSPDAIDPIGSGQDAGFAVLTLMRQTQETIKPKEIVEAFKAANGQDELTDALAEQFEDRTVTCLARGASYLAAIWTSAWAAADGALKIKDRGIVAEQQLIDLYVDPKELPSMHLDTIGPLLKKREPTRVRAVGDTPSAGRRRKSGSSPAARKSGGRPAAAEPKARR
jgi:hypothetical protein